MSFQNDRITGIPAPLPRDYDRQFNFAGFQASNPASPLPAQQLDIELNAIEEALDETQARQRLIQRDDGALQNQSVGLDQLKNEALIGVEAPDDWVAFTSYAKNQSVIVDGAKWYIALQSHVASNVFADDLAAGYWRLLIDLSPYTTQAEAARDAAQAAQAAAEQAETDAQTAQAAAEQAETDAQTAQGLAEDARDDAQTARTGAQTAQGLAEDALDEFTDLWLGTKAADPTTDNDGDALQEGALYLNTTTDYLRVYRSGAWVNAAISANGATDIPYNNSGSGLSATNVQTAIDELDSDLAAFESEVDTRLGTTGNLGSMANEDAGDYLPRSEFDPESPTPVWVGDTAGVPLSSLPASARTPGLFILETVEGTFSVFVHMTAPNFDILGTGKVRFTSPDGHLSWFAEYSTIQTFYVRTYYTNTAHSSFSSGNQNIRRILKV